MVPYRRWDSLYAVLFHQQRMLRCDRLPQVQREADRYISAQKHLKELLQKLHASAQIDFFFLGGYGLSFGEGSDDFSFLQLTKSARQGGGDGGLQISSAVPGTKYSPEEVRSDSAWFPENSFYYARQPHEIGDNPDAMAKLLALAMETQDKESGETG